MVNHDKPIDGSTRMDSLSTSPQRTDAGSVQPYIDLESQVPLATSAPSSVDAGSLTVLQASVPDNGTSGIAKALTALGKGCQKIGYGGKIVIVGFVCTTAVFILAKAAALISGIVSSALAGTFLLSPFGWGYLALRDKSDMGTDFQSLTEAALWPSAILSTLAQQCILKACGNQKIANKVLKASKRLDIIFTEIGALTGTVALTGSAAIPGLAPAVIGGLIGAGAVLGCGTWRVFPSLEAEFKKAD